MLDGKIPKRFAPLALSHLGLYGQWGHVGLSKIRIEPFVHLPIKPEIPLPARSPPSFPHLSCCRQICGHRHHHASEPRNAQRSLRPLGQQGLVLG